MLTRGTHWNRISLYNIHLEGAYKGQQRSHGDLQFDLENVLTMSQLVGKSAEERNAASVMLDILASSKVKTEAQVAGYGHHCPVKTQRTEGDVRGACGKHCQTSQRVSFARRRNKERKMGWEAARKGWPRLGRDEFHKSVPVRLAEGETVRRRVVRVGHEGLEASTRVTELTCD